MRSQSDWSGWMVYISWWNLPNTPNNTWGVNASIAELNCGSVASLPLLVTEVENCSSQTKTWQVWTHPKYPVASLYKVILCVCFSKLLLKLGAHEFHMKHQALIQSWANRFLSRTGWSSLRCGSVEYKLSSRLCQVWKSELCSVSPSGAPAGGGASAGESRCSRWRLLHLWDRWTLLPLPGTQPHAHITPLWTWSASWWSFQYKGSSNICFQIDPLKKKRRKNIYVIERKKMPNVR